MAQIPTSTACQILSGFAVGTVLICIPLAISFFWNLPIVAAVAFPAIAMLVWGAYFFLMLLPSLPLTSKSLGEDAPKGLIAAQFIVPLAVYAVVHVVTEHSDRAFEALLRQLASPAVELTNGTGLPLVISWPSGSAQGDDLALQLKTDVLVVDTIRRSKRIGVRHRPFDGKKCREAANVISALKLSSEGSHGACIEHADFFTIPEDAILWSKTRPHLEARFGKAIVDVVTLTERRGGVDKILTAFSTGVVRGQFVQVPQPSNGILLQVYGVQTDKRPHPSTTARQTVDLANEYVGDNEPQVREAAIAALISGYSWLERSFCRRIDKYNFPDTPECKAFLAEVSASVLELSQSVFADTRSQAAKFAHFLKEVR